jgi:hypothetical protein
MMKHPALIGQTRFDRLSVPLRVGFSVARSGILSLSKDAMRNLSD